MLRRMLLCLTAGVLGGLLVWSAFLSSSNAGQADTQASPPSASQENKENKGNTEKGPSPADKSANPIGSAPGEDITAKVREINSPRYPAPPSQFRVGHAKAMAENRVQRRRQAQGFTLEFPSQAPIPTPTVYEGKLYVGGGFRSRQFYCFDAKTGEPIWSVDLSDDGPSSAVCSDGIVIFNTESCTLFALDARTGKHLWSYWLGDPLTSTPTIANGMVFTSYPCAGRFAGVPPLPKLPPAGGPKPVKPPAGGPKPVDEPSLSGPQPAQTPSGNGQPAPAAGNPPLPPPTHAFIAIELKTGKILWQRWIDSDVISAPVADGDEVLAATFAGTLYRFQQRDGTIVSARRCRITSAPTVVGEQVYWTQRADYDRQVAEAVVAADLRNQVVKLAAARQAAPYLDREVQGRTKLATFAKSLDQGNALGLGAQQAANAAAAMFNIGQANISALQAFQGSRVLHFRQQLYSTMGDKIVCVDVRTGKEKWERKVSGDLLKEGGYLATAPALAGDRLVVATLKGEVLLLEPNQGEVVKTYTVGHPVRAQPAIVEGRIYVSTFDGRVVCIDTGDAQLTGWSTWGGDMGHTNLSAANPRAK
ncbi:MAG: PQQ-binding-like beta-propeller repeat protein, partial [Thermogemmata sp.]